jgi:ferredoxin
MKGGVMGKCKNHPDRETNHVCMKHNIYMCEECIKCPDPKIHCKFRSSCPIWFMDKRGGKSIDDGPVKQDTKKFNVVFQPENKNAFVEKGFTLLDAAHIADVPLNASCNGKGVCGKCKLAIGRNHQRWQACLRSARSCRFGYVHQMVHAFESGQKRRR